MANLLNQESNMEVIIGVIIGGVIGYVAAITTLVVEHRRWRKEFKLQYLITERIRREKQCDRIEELLAKGLCEDSYPMELFVNIWMRLPQYIRNPIDEAWDGIDDSQLEGKRKLYQEVSAILGAYLYEIDKQIEELTHNK